MNNGNNTAENTAAQNPSTNGKTKFCKHCGGTIAEEAVICPLCGC